MTTQDLERISIEAGATAYELRASMPHAKSEQEARAWDRLADAADSLHAMRMRCSAYVDQRIVPPPGQVTGTGTDRP